MYKARRSGMKREMFGYVPGGYQRILQTLTSELEKRGVEILTSSPVENIEYDSVDRNLRVTCGSGDRARTLTFDRVINTAPSPIISRSCPSLTDDEQRRLGSAEYIGVVCTSLLLDRPLGGYYVTNITDSGIPLTGVIEMDRSLRPST